MSKNNRKKEYTNSAKPVKNSLFGQAMITIIILGVITLLFINVILPRMKNKIKEVTAEKTVDIITQNAEKIAGENPEVAQFLESISEEDKETVTEIISEHMDAETVTEVMEYVKDGNKEELIKYAQDNLSESEISDLMEIYGKYAK
ncbi:MAG: hypothetical protein IKO76_08970 [Butyrivibrio sp.]|nr:hypothetical protein [Butyrivibrio sp.]